ncbi:hypothetical protein HY947_06485 [Candidatus Gottesmanbacteria bacterium]|nr:hypothetical protein [Candidatus Gottesmanbacteria bacterium]
MKKILFIIVLGLLFFGFSQTFQVNAQDMMARFTSPSSTSTTSVSTTAKDEAEGKVIYDRLQSKEKSCKDLTDDDFDVLGDYFMGQRLGNTATHDSMNTMMKNMMGEDGEKQMHISLGKRLSGCNVDAQLPAQGSNFLPMMGLGGMIGGFSNDNWSGTGSMMGFNRSTPFFGLLIQTLIVIFLVFGIIYFWNGITKKSKK